MAMYAVENQWGGNSAPWNPGGTWILGSRNNQALIAVNLVSNDGGETYDGASSTINYIGEGPIGFKATSLGENRYQTQNQWGGSDAPWHDGGVWTIGDRDSQKVTSFSATSQDGIMFSGTNVYTGEGPIGFRGTLIS